MQSAFIHLIGEHADHNLVKLAFLPLPVKGKNLVLIADTLRLLIYIPDNIRLFLGNLFTDLYGCKAVIKKCIILYKTSTLNDGAAAVVVMSAQKAKELGVIPMLKIEGYAVSGYDAELMGCSPYFSSKKLASQLNLDLKDIDMFEINEAFASQAYAVSRDLGLDKDKVNIYGGGISIGHPIGATGCILTVKVLYELMRSDKKNAMISMCIGGGQGISMYFSKL